MKNIWKISVLLGLLGLVVAVLWALLVFTFGDIKQPAPLLFEIIAKSSIWLVIIGLLGIVVVNFKSIMEDINEK